MANIGEPTEMNRRLLMSTTHLILLYGAEIWEKKFIEQEVRRKVLARVQYTAALRLSSANRTVSEQDLWSYLCKWRVSKKDEP